MGRMWAGTLKDVRGNVDFCSRGTVIYRLLCWCWFRDDDDDAQRQWLDLRTKSFKSLTGSLIERKKKYLYLLYEGVVCFLGMRVYFLLYEPCLWCYLFIIFKKLFILFMSHWIFVIVSSGLAVSPDGDVVEIRTKWEDAKQMSQSKTRPKTEIATEEDALCGTSSHSY